MIPFGWGGAPKSWRGQTRHLLGATVAERRWRFVLGLMILLIGWLSIIVYCRSVADHQSRAWFISGALVVVIIAQVLAAVVLRRVGVGDPPRGG